MDINTAQYEFSHGKKPRGQGFWWFRITGTDGAGKYTTAEHSANGTMREAARIAVRQVRADIGAFKQLVEVEVMP